ncbi:MAG: 3-deoxy-D-manno-octulosonic acid kinase [Gammaproteobacteria bacterium]|nr:3-deoxy-D-manno-octulosonic acid kinase [Gammaproteobacteria bacterium]
MLIALIHIYFSSYQLKKKIYSMATKILRNKRTFIILNEDLPDISENIFTHFEDNQALESGRKEAGRGTVTFFRDCRLDLVHKTYKRGGLIRKLVTSHYLWTGLTKTRAHIEFDGLKKMFDLGLPVPRPIAARIIRKGIFYRAELITQEIEKATTFGENLAAKNLSSDMLKELGLAIKSLHREGFMHPDLNIENILIGNSKKIFFLDFDQAQPLKQKEIQFGRDIERLRRSIKKFCLKNERDFPEREWHIVLETYGSNIL